MKIRKSLTNHKTSRDYEALVERLISQEMDGLSGVEALQIGRDAKLKGLSGYEHQIDVFYKFRLWKTEFLVLVECKQYRKKVSVNDLLVFRARIDDLKAHKGILITSSGFQSGATKFAAANRIALLIIRGTRLIDVRYCLTFPSDEEKCDRQVAQLKQFYSSRPVEERLLVAADHSHVAVACEGVTVAISPGELRFSMLSRDDCPYEEADAGCYFEEPQHGRLVPGRLLKALLLDEIITRDNSA